MTNRAKRRIVFNSDASIDEEEIEGPFRITYKWRLKILDETGTQIGGDYTPCHGNLFFTISSIDKHTALTLVSQNRDDFLFRERIRQQNDDDAWPESKSVPRIHAKLRPGGNIINTPHYRLFGCGTPIESFELTIRELDRDVTYLEGSPALESDMGEDFSYPSSLLIQVGLTPPKFKELWAQMEDLEAGENQVVLENCAGFYAVESSAPIGPSEIMVLLDEKKQAVENLPEGYELPVLGSRNSLTISRLQKFGDTESEDNFAEEGTDDLLEIKDSLNSLTKFMEQNALRAEWTNKLLLGVLLVVAFGIASLARATPVT